MASRRSRKSDLWLSPQGVCGVFLEGDPKAREKGSIGVRDALSLSRDYERDQALRIALNQGTLVFRLLLTPASWERAK